MSMDEMVNSEFYENSFFILSLLESLVNYFGSFPFGNRFGLTFESSFLKDT
jgi:hypothetical protein